jgi:hypothetical protein
MLPSVTFYSHLGQPQKVFSSLTAEGAMSEIAEMGINGSSRVIGTGLSVTSIDQVNALNTAAQHIGNTAAINIQYGTSIVGSTVAPYIVKKFGEEATIEVIAGGITIAGDGLTFMGLVEGAALAAQIAGDSIWWLP